MARFFREEFDRGRNFVVARSFTFNAQGFVPGQPIDKTLFSLRRLRQLYDKRDIAFDDGTVVPIRPIVPVPPKIERYRPKIERRRIERRRAGSPE